MWLKILNLNLDKARSLMKEQGLDCIIATSHDNVYYSSGSEITTITSLKRLAAVFIPLDDEPFFGVHANEEITARKKSWIKDIRVYEGGEWEPLKPLKFVADMLKEKNLANSRIGIEKQEISSMWFEYLQKLFPSAEFKDSKFVFDKLRVVKTSEELKLLSEINMATAKAITTAYEMARPGDTERQIARNMIDLFLEYGADTVKMMYLGAGKNTLELHHVPKKYKIKKGDLVHVDCGGAWTGYGSDISRMAVVGEPSEKQLKAYNLIVKAERDTAQAMEAGATVLEVHKATKRSWESQGYKYRRAFIGHSMGIGSHEYPMLCDAHGDWVLESNMFFQLEPGVSLEKFRVHTEDSFIVREEGPAENVSEYRDISELQIIK